MRRGQDPDEKKESQKHDIEEWCSSAASKLQGDIVAELNKPPQDRSMHLLTADYADGRQDDFKLSTTVRMVITRQDVDEFISDCGLEDNPQLEEPIKHLFGCVCNQMPNMLTVSEATSLLQAFMHACYRWHTEEKDHDETDGSSYDEAADEEDDPEADGLKRLMKHVTRFLEILAEEFVDKGVFTRKTAGMAMTALRELKAAKTLKQRPAFLDAGAHPTAHCPLCSARACKCALALSVCCCVVLAVMSIGTKFSKEQTKFSHMMWCTSKKPGPEISKTFWDPFTGDATAYSCSPCG